MIAEKSKSTEMKTLNISISENELTRFGIKESNFNFSDFVAIVSKELTRQNLSKSIELAEKYGLSEMTMDEITNEVKVVRRYAKNRN
jgi:DNA-binding Xre family transcriptional regulator